jgi:hypothetical protein
MNTEHFGEIIREASTSTLGILALIILLLGSLAVVFFGKSSEKARMTIWIMAFGGALLFGFAILRAGRESERREPSTDLEVRPALPGKRASINIVYAGDLHQCRLPLTISIGDQAFQPQGNFGRLEQVEIGRQTYRIFGTIICPYIGNCTVDSEGTIEVSDSQSYNLSWQNTAPGQCEAVLYVG